MAADPGSSECSPCEGFEIGAALGVEAQAPSPLPGFRPVRLGRVGTDADQDVPRPYAAGLGELRGMLLVESAHRLGVDLDAGEDRRFEDPLDEQVPPGLPPQDRQ